MGWVSVHSTLQSVMYTVLFSAGVAALLVWARVRFQVGRMSRHLHAIFEQRKQLALAAGNGADVKARAAGASAVTLMGDLKGVHRYKDVRQVSVLCRDMRKWDEDNVPDAEAAEYGEFILKVRAQGPDTVPRRMQQDERSGPKHAWGTAVQLACCSS